MPILLYLLALALFAQGTSEFVFSGLLPDIAADLGRPIPQVALLTPAFAAGMVLGAPVMGAFGRGLPPQAALAGFLALFVAAHALGALTDSFPLLLASRVLAALANAGFIALALAAAVRIAPAGAQARAIAVLLGGTTLALIAGVPLGALVGAQLGWRATLWGIAGLCLPVLVALLAAAPERFRAPGAAPIPVGAELRALRAPGVGRAVLLAALVNAALFGSFTYLAVTATAAAGIPGGAVPALLALFGAGAFLGTLAAGRLGDQRWRASIGAAGPGLAAGWFLLAAGAGSPAVFWLGAPLLGGLSFLLGSLLIGRIMAAGRHAGALAGAAATVALNLGAIAGPLLAGAALAPVGPRGPLLVSGALALAAALLWWRAPVLTGGSGTGPAPAAG